MNVFFTIMLTMAVLTTPAQQAVDPLLAEIIQQTREHAAKYAQPGSVKGPVLLDVASFQAAQRIAGQHVLKSSDLVSLAGPHARAATEAEAIDTLPIPAGRKYPNLKLADDGLYIRLDSLSRSGTSAVAIVTYMYTEYRPTGSSAIGGAELEYRLALRNGAWRVDGIQIRKQS